MQDVCAEDRIDEERHLRVAALEVGALSCACVRIRRCAQTSGHDQVVSQFTHRRASSLNMDPKDLKILFDKKAEDKASAEKTQRASAAALKAETDFRQYQGQEAILKVVIPYFTEIAQTVGADNFKFTEVPDGNPLSKLPLGVRFMIGSSVEYEISVASSKVWIKTVGSKSAGVSVVFVYPSTQEPHISEPGDLTREKLGKLLALVIAET
jgi:hypothetical protein